MSRTIRLLILALGLSALLAPAAQASPAQTSIMMDDDLLRLSRRQHRGGDPDAHEDARRRHRARDRAVEGRRGERAPVQVRDRQAARCGEDARAHAGPALPGGEPEDLPAPQLGPLRQPRQGGPEHRHQDLLQHHGPRAGVGARDAAEGQRPATFDLQAQGGGVQAVRDRGRQALRRDVPRRERQPRDPPARELLVAVERAQPGRLAVAAVGAARQPDGPGFAGDLPPAAPVRLPRPARERPPHRHATSSSWARRPRSARMRRPRSRRCARRCSCARSRASSPTGRPYTGRAASLRSCGDFAARGPLHANGYAHHPYTKNVPPNGRRPESRLADDGEHLEPRHAARRPVGEDQRLDQAAACRCS